MPMPRENIFWPKQETGSTTWTIFLQAGSLACRAVGGFHGALSFA